MGSSTTFAALYLRVSVPSIVRAGIQGRPMAAALNLHWKAALESSATTLTLLPSTARLPAGLSPLSSWPKL